MTTAAIRRDILKGWNVLIADDEPDSLEVATRILRYYGANVATASNGQEALDLVSKVSPRFVISDLSMPVVDGWGLLYGLKQNRDTADIPVIALTAHSMVGDRQRAIDAGFHNYLTKPLTAANFMRDLLQLLMAEPSLAPELGG